MGQGTPIFGDFPFIIAAMAKTRHFKSDMWLAFEKVINF